MRVFVIAGEASGDILGAGLMRGLRSLRPDIEFAGIGGVQMQAEGLRSLFDMQDLSVMGLTEIVPHIPKLLARITQTGSAIAEMAPDVLVTVDSPGFCLRVARKAKATRPGLRTVHYVAPSVWAWRPERAARMARYVDHVLALLPFEPDYMIRAGMTCDFVGHPAVTAPQATPDQVAAFRARHGQRIMTLLPGSRNGELDRLLPVFGDVVRRVLRDRSGLNVVVPAAPRMESRLRAYFAAERDRVAILPDAADGQAKRACFAASEVALAASGTVSLELAAAGTPMVIAYRASWLTTMMVRRMALIEDASLVNIVSGSKVVPEFLFGDCTLDKVLPAVMALLDTPDLAADQRAEFGRVMQMLGRGGEDPGLRAARSVLGALTR